MCAMLPSSGHKIALHHHIINAHITAFIVLFYTGRETFIHEQGHIEMMETTAVCLWSSLCQTELRTLGHSLIPLSNVCSRSVSSVPLDFQIRRGHIRRNPVEAINQTWTSLISRGYIGVRVLRRRQALCHRGYMKAFLVKKSSERGAFVWPSFE